MLSRRRSLILGLLLLLVALSAWLFLGVKIVPAAEITDWFVRSGSRPWAIPAFLLAYVIFNLLLIPPGFLSAAAALMWGWWVGGLIELVVATLASFPPYLLSRGATTDWLARRFGPGFTAFQYRLEKEGFVSLLIVRLLPIIPYSIVNYAAGAANIRTRHYALATLMGMIPSIFIFTYFVDAIRHGLASPQDAFLRMLGAGVLLSGFVLLVRFAAKRVADRP